MKIKTILYSLFGVNKRNVESEPQVYLEDDKIKFKNIKIYTGVFDIIEDIHLSEIEGMIICSEYDRGNSEASLFIKVTSREQVIDIDSCMIGFEKFLGHIFRTFRIDKSYHKFYNKSIRLQYIYPLNKQGELVDVTDEKSFKL